MMTMAELLQIERSLAKHIAEHEARHMGKEVPVPWKLVQARWRNIEYVLKLANIEKCPLPDEVLHHLTLQAGYLASGLLPRSISEAIHNKGAPIGPTRKAELGLAVFYVESVRRKVIKNPNGVRTMARLFKVAERTVQDWTIKIEPTCPAASYKEFHSMLNEAARRYRLFGHSITALHNRGKRPTSALTHSEGTGI